MLVDMRRLVLAAGGGRDLSPQHYDPEVAQARGVRTAFANTTLQMAFVNTVVDGWLGAIGANGRLAKLSLRMKAPIFLGTTMRCAAKVIKVWSDEQGCFANLDCEIHTEDGLCSIAQVSIEFTGEDS
jgi:acyl dehydratase